MAMLHQALASPARRRQPRASSRPRERRAAPAHALLALLVASLLGMAPGCSLLLDFDVPVDAAANLDAGPADAAPADADVPDAESDADVDAAVHEASSIDADET